MPNGFSNASGFNRVAQVLLGATADKIISVGITTPKRKLLNSIHVSAIKPVSPAAVEILTLKVAVCSAPTGLLGDPTILDFNVLNSVGSESVQLGTVYYLNTIQLPYNNPIIFDSPMLFTEGEPIYIIASVPYAATDSLLTVPTRNVTLSVNGNYIESDNVKYTFR